MIGKESEETEDGAKGGNDDCRGEELPQTGGGAPPYGKGGRKATHGLVRRHVDP